MSSAILYLAIVAIWAFCLVPRWVRRAHSAPAAALAEAPSESGPADSGAASPSAGEAPGVLTAEASAAPELAALRDTAMTSGSAPAAATASLAESADGEELSGRPVPAAPAPVSRTAMLRARRRLLAGLIALAAVGAVGTTAKLAAWWLFIPPAAMLGLYLLLLREAALADAEQARWRAEQAALRASAARERVLAARADRAAWAASQPQRTAEVIDISARVGGDQFYDQYADSAARAAGD